MALTLMQAKICLSHSWVNSMSAILCQACCNWCSTTFKSSTYQIFAQAIQNKKPGRMQKNSCWNKSLISLSSVGYTAWQTEHFDKYFNSLVKFELKKEGRK